MLEDAAGSKQGHVYPVGSQQQQQRLLAGEQLFERLVLEF